MGYLYCDFKSRYLMPLRSDMTHFERSSSDELIPESPGHHQEWINACKTGKARRCDFDYSGTLIEHNLLALVAYRVGRKLQWDANALSAANCPEATRFIRKTYRTGWTLDG